MYMLYLILCSVLLHIGSEKCVESTPKSFFLENDIEKISIGNLGRETHECFTSVYMIAINCAIVIFSSVSDRNGLDSPFG